MGKPSITNPGRRNGSLRARWGGVSILLCLVLACVARAQTPLFLPSAIVFDVQGNLYFAETGNHVVRRLAPSGVITTVAGTGVQGFAGDGAAATGAELDSPAGLAISAAGELYIADTHNHRVRKVSTAGIITTVAGTGAASYFGDGGVATSAELVLPTALALDATGNLYVADAGDHRVRKIAAGTGVITTVAGDGVERFAGDGGVATAASIDSPNGLAVDAAGNLYIADTHNGRVREVSAANGLISMVAGAGSGLAFGGDGGAATAAALALPRGLAIDAAGNIYIVDSANHRVRRISSSGTMSTVVGEGTQTFAGDGAPAVAAGLDSPHAVAMSPAGLLTLSDSNNQRIRQLDGLPAPGPNIRTIVGVGTVAVDTLSLSGPISVTYGGGVVTANLSGGPTATGSVSFVDTVGGKAVLLGAGNLNGGTTTFSTSGLSAGQHSIVASYAGDASHVAAQSSALALTVTPLSLTATANPTSMLYGQAVPALTGALSGVLAQDAGNVSAVFSSTAGSLSPVGTYPIRVTLSGNAVANYSVGTAMGNLTIAQVPAVISMSTTGGLTLGSPVAVNLLVSSTTSGTPTGSVTLLDGATVLASVPIASGSAAFSTTALALGAHSLSAVYSGDTNFLGVASASSVVTIGAASDFTLGATGATSQSVPAGSTATFQFAVAMQGPAMSSPITLSAQGAPVGATVSLTPTLLPPGGSATSFTLTIQTPFAGLERRPRPGSFGGVPVLAVLLIPFVGVLSKRYRIRGLLVFVAGCGLLLATGCGNRVNIAPETVTAKSYTITVTGTATSSTGTALQHSVNVTLQVL